MPNKHSDDLLHDGSDMLDFPVFCEFGRIPSALLHNSKVILMWRVRALGHFPSLLWELSGLIHFG